MTPRTLKILAYLHRAGPSRLIDVSREVGPARSSAHAALSRLERRGLVVHSGRGGVWSLAFPDIDPLAEYDARVPGYVLMGYAINDRTGAIAASEIARTRLRHARSCDDARRSP
ncbi:hypothetical protein BLA60_39465 [Actinophytocola xinjiangensis]|uniref:HTH iclR-type domain-containing protein n=1 Tax=Actinophytocola xinjiangensis TaxID=485602 RepID=A0A7Z0WDW4_9PSEU|nr:hypothetical protein BLA60_39465 [Actinophytocola xinjiangensis]